MVDNLETQEENQYFDQKVPNEIFNEAYQTENKSLLLDQYKLYVDMHDKVVERRGRTNNFYISLLSGALAFISILGNEKILNINRSIDPLVIVFLVGLLGLSLCFLWLINIRGYAFLIRRKVKVIREMEKYLPFYAYCREEVLWREEIGERFTKALRISTTEQFVSIVFGAVFLVITVYSFINLRK